MGNGPLLDSGWPSAGHCHGGNNDKAHVASWAARNEKRTARRKLLLACAVSLVFMTGEVIGEAQRKDTITGVWSCVTYC